MIPPAVAVTSGAQARTAPYSLILFVLLLAAVLAPVLCFAIPAGMADYPNHLARMFILARDGGPQANPFYEVVWSFIPNLAMDLIVPRVGRLIGVETAARLFYLVSQILIVTGPMAIERVVKGRVHIAGFAALMFVYSQPFAWGFVNFEFGLGCALLGFAGAIYVQERSWAVRLALHTAVIAVLFTAHLFTLGIYGFAAGMHELWRAWSRRATLRETISRLAMLAMPSLALVVLMTGSGSTVGDAGTTWDFSRKHLWLMHILSGYSLPLSAVCVVVLIWLTVSLTSRGALRFEQSGAWLLAGFIALYIVMPFKLLDTAYVDMRVIVAAALVMPAFVSVTFPNRIWSHIAVVAVCAVALVNAGLVTGVWMAYRTDYADAQKSFALLPKRALVLVGHSGDGDDPPADLMDYPIYNVPTLAVHYADAFVMNLFTDPGKQPVSPRAPWRRLAVHYGSLAPVKLLKTIAEQGPPSGTPGFLQTWQHDFDYLYLIGPAIENPMPDRIVPVLVSRRFALYRIRK
jgi:hypothetical protein